MINIRKWLSISCKNTAGVEHHSSEQSKASEIKPNQCWLWEDDRLRTLLKNSLVASPAGPAVSWLQMTSPRPHPQRTGASSRPSLRRRAPPTWRTSNHWLRSRMTPPSAPPTARLSTCFVSTTKVRPTKMWRKLWAKPRYMASCCDLCLWCSGVL